MATAMIMAMRFLTVNNRLYDWHFDSIRHLLVNGHKFFHVIGYMAHDSVWNFFYHRKWYNFLNRNGDFLNNGHGVWFGNWYLYWICLRLWHQHRMWNLNVHRTLN